MPGRPTQSQPLQYIGALAALIAIVGYVVFDWRFGESDGIVPLAIGIVCVLLAIGWTLSQRR